jgi:hypothetical protein
MSSGTAQMETIIANAGRLKKTVIINGTSQVVPGYGTAMCIMVGIISLSTIKTVVMAPE